MLRDRLEPKRITDSFLIRNDVNKVICKKAVYDMDIEELLLWLCGFFGTMPILTLFGNTLFTYLLLALTAYSLISFFTGTDGRTDGIAFKKQIIPVVLIMILNIISGLYCLLGDMPEVYKGGTGTSIVVETMYGLFFIVYFLRGKTGLVRKYLNGVYAASLFQLLYCILQIAYEHLTGSILNSILFNIVKTNGITVTGLCWHPSNLAPLFVFGCFMTRSPIIKALFMAVSLIIGNRTAVIGVFLVVLLELAVYLYVNRSRFRVRTIGVVLLLVAALVVVVAVLKTSLGDVIREKFATLSKKINNGIASDMHVYYWTSLPELFPVVSKWNALYPLIGVGPGNSGYIMTRHINMYPGIRWVIECDYVNDLWSYGILGFIARYVFYFVYVIRSLKVDIGYAVFFVVFFAMGVTYNVMYGWCMLLVYSMFILISVGERLK